MKKKKLKKAKKPFTKALIKAKGDRAKAAKIMKMSRATFFRRLKELKMTNINIWV